MLRILRLVVCFSLFGLIAACSSSGSGGQSGDSPGPVKIGFIDSLTGEIATVGTEQQNALKLAVKQINAKTSGRKLQVVTEDDQSTPQGAVTGIQRLLANKSIVGIVGETDTPLGDAVLPLVAHDGRPMIFLQVTSLPNRPSNVFSLGPPQGTLGVLASKYVFPGVKGKRLANIVAEQASLQEFAAGVQKIATADHMDVVSNQSYPPTQTQFGSIVTNTLASHPNVISCSCFSPGAGTLISAIRSAGYTGVLFGQQAIAQANAIQTGGKALAGAIASAYWDPSVAAISPASASFLKAYKAAYPSLPTPDGFAVQAYDAAYIIDRAINSVGTSASALSHYVSTTTFHGVLQNDIKFEKSGFADLKGYILRANSQGKFSLVKP